MNSLPSITDFVNQTATEPAANGQSSGMESPVDIIRQVASERGVNPDYLIGLAKLETRLGGASIKGGGNDTRNLFNIKDFSKAGTGTRALDKAEGSNDRYRQYGNYRESVEDLLGLLERKYPGAINAESGQQFAEILKQGGYATDPNYVQKLAGVIGGAKSTPGAVKPGAYYEGHNRQTVGAQPGVAGMTIGDFAKAFGASTAEAVGSVGQFAGEGAAYIANKLTGSEDYEGKNPLSPIADYARDSLSEGGKAAMADSNIEGDAVEMLLGNFDNVRLPDTAGGFAMLAANGFGSLAASFIPIAGQAGKLNQLRKGIALADQAGDAATVAKLTAEAGKLAKSTAMRGAGFGAAMTGGAAASEARENVEKQVGGMEHADLMAGVPVYAEAFARTGDEVQARNAVVNAAGQFSALISAPFGAAGGYLGGKVITDTLLKKGLSNIVGNSVASTTGRAVGAGVVGGLVEGGQEVTEKVGGNLGENLAMGRDWNDDLTRNTAGDFIGGAMVGGPVGAVTGMAAQPVNPVVKQLDEQIAQGNSPLSRAAKSTLDPIAQRVSEVETAFREGGLLDKLGEMGQGDLTRQEFLEALSIARNPSQPAAYRARAMESVEQAMTWLAQGSMPNEPGTGKPFGTELANTNQPVTDLATQAGGELTNPGAPEFFDGNTVDGEAVRTDNMLDGPRALPPPPGQPIATQPADAGFFTPEDFTSATTPVADDFPAEAAVEPAELAIEATESVAEAAPIQDVAPAAAAAPVARKLVTAPKAMALPETQSNPGTAQTRKRKVQLEAMAATGFGVVERRPDGFFLVNEAAQEEMRLDSPGDAQMARAAIARSTPVVGQAINNTWTAFHPESGTLNIPRAEMPQIKAEHRGAMVNFLAARGIKGAQSIEPATDLKPTQAEFSQSKVDQAKAFQGNDRPVLVSSDGHILDGHHQWMAKMQNQAPVKVMRLNAPIAKLLQVMQEFPSAGMTKAPSTLQSQTGAQDAVRSDGRGNAGAGLDAAGTTNSVAGVGNQSGTSDGQGLRGDGLRDTPAQGAGTRGRALRNPSADTQAALALSEKEGRSIELADPANPLTQAVDSLLDVMAGLTGYRGIAVHDTSPKAFDGAAYLGRTFINVANPQMHVGQTIAHEFKHLTEKYPALKALYDRMWDLIPAETRRSYFENYLRKERRDAQGNIIRAQGDFTKATAQELQLLKDEMLADFMGQRFNDKAWLQQLAKQKPALFGNFVREWLAVLDNIIDALKGLMNRDGSRGIKDKDLDAQLKNYLSELRQMKALATEVAIAWAEKNPGLAENTGAAEVIYSARDDDLDLGSLLDDEVDADRMAEPNAKLDAEQGRSERTQAEAEYTAIEEKFRGTDDWMKAPNGEPTLLNERQWVQVRTPQFKKWFGDWEYFAANGGVWTDAEGKVSKAVSDNGEPLVVYHGTDKGGFMKFREPRGDKRGDLGIFTTSNADMARSYVRRGRPQELDPKPEAQKLEEIGVVIEAFRGRLSSRETEDRTLYEYTDPMGRTVGPFATEEQATQDAITDFWDGEEEVVATIYGAFVNLRNPNEDNFEGALWNGDRSQQWQVVVGDEVQYKDGKAFFEEDEAREFAKEFANPDDEYEGADYMVAAEDHYNTTDGVVRDARRMDSDGAIIREVVDDGGGPGYGLEPSDVFVAFKPNQLKSADFNTGEFGQSEDIRYSERPPQELTKDIPEIGPDFLIGKTYFPIPADLTIAGTYFTGIDSSQVAIPVLTQGGPLFPAINEYMDAGVGWAVNDLGVARKKLGKIKGGKKSYAIVSAMSQVAHQSNKTVVESMIGVISAYYRDGRMSRADIDGLDAYLRSYEYIVDVKKAGKKAKETRNFSGMPISLHEASTKEGLQKLLNYIERDLTFDDRSALSDALAVKKGSEAYNGPNIAKVLDALMQPEFSGATFGDALVVVELDPIAKDALVEAKDIGVTPHNSYKYLIKGKIVGKLSRTMGWETLFPDFFAQRRATGGSKNHDSIAFMRGLPVQTGTKAMFEGLGFQGVANSKTAKVAIDFASNNWRSTEALKKDGGVSAADFVAAINESTHSASLTNYTLKDISKNKKTMRVYQLADHRIFFALKKGNPGYADYIDMEPGAPGFDENDMMLTSVVSNEAAVKGIAPAILLKAIEEGVTCLDCFSANNDNYPKGFLPTLYEFFGFQRVGSVPFSASMVIEEGGLNQLRDLEYAWKRDGWIPKTDDNGNISNYPEVVAMKWTGTNEDRLNATDRFIRTGDHRAANSSSPQQGGGTVGFADTRKADRSGPRQDSGKGRTGRADAGGSSRDLPNRDRARLAERIRRSVIAVAGLSDANIKAFSLDVKRAQEVREKYSGVQLSERVTKSATVQMSVEQLVQAAESMVSWRDWYDRHEKVITDMFGQDAKLFQQILSATSQAASVKANVGLALKAYRQMLAGDELVGYLPAVIKNLERIKSNTALSGAKISQYDDANNGNDDAIAVDRHIAMLFFDTKTPSRLQIISAKEAIRSTATRLGWKPKEVQAALWAYNQVRLGTDPTKVISYDTVLNAKSEQVIQLRTQLGRGEVGGVRANGTTHWRDGGQNKVSDGLGDGNVKRVDPGRRPAGGGAADSQGLSQQPGFARQGIGQGQGELGRLDPLPGAPSVPGYHGPDPRLVSVAEQYARANGIDLKRQSEFVTVDPDRAKRIAKAYADMAHAPKNPRVKEAYANLIQQTLAQYQALVDAGYKFWFIDFDAPGNAQYVSTPWNAMRDVRENQTMGVFPTEDGFGSGDAISNNPLETTVMDFTWPSGGLDGPQKKVLANDLFRAVHDAFGHGLEGAGFRAQGEENAWQAHRRLFKGSAVAAITSETRGQNSWLNYGPNGDANKAAKVEDTVFADQKTGLMPEWTWTEGVAGDLSYSERTNENDAETTRARELANIQRGGGGRQAGDGAAPRYGKPIAGATSATGYHFSRQARTSLNSEYYGTGLKGAEAERLGGSGNADIRPRVFFYVNKGNGVRAESGVGGYGHHVQLDNLYDVLKDELNLVKGVRGQPGSRENNWERAVMSAGFDGYLVSDPVMLQGYAVLLGKKHGAVPVEQTQAPVANPNPVMEKPADPGATRIEGDELVKKPRATEMLQLANPARRAAIQASAPSFVLRFGSFRVKASEAPAADMAMAQFSPTFKFGNPRYSERQPTIDVGRKVDKIEQRMATMRRLLACVA